jgi:hypothetical protein
LASLQLPLRNCRVCEAVRRVEVLLGQLRAERERVRRHLPARLVHEQEARERRRRAVETVDLQPVEKVPRFLQRVAQVVSGAARSLRISQSNIDVYSADNVDNNALKNSSAFADSRKNARYLPKTRLSLSGVRSVFVVTRSNAGGYSKRRV